MNNPSLGSNVFTYLTVIGATSGYVTLTVPGAVTSYFLNLPAAQGGAGTALVNDGSGNLSWTAVTAGVTALAAVGAVPNANGASISGSTLTLQPASATLPGLLTAGVQGIGGAKTFAALATFSLGVAVTGNVRMSGALGVGNSAAATTPGTVTKKMEVFDSAGVSLGFLAIYDAIS